LAGLAAVAVLAVLVGQGPTAAAWARAVEELWPAGLLREPGKALMLALLLPACGAAVAANRLLDHRRNLGLAAIGVVAATSVAAWIAFTGPIGASAYPREWTEARAVADIDDCPFAVLGDGAYVNAGFTGDRIVAHPARWFFGPRAVVSNDAEMPGLRPRPPETAPQRWAGEVNDRYLHDDGPAPRAADAADAGVGWVFVDRPVDRPDLGLELAAGGFELAYRSDRADLWQVPGGCS